MREGLSCTSGSVDGAARLAASTHRGVPWCFGLLAQTGLVCVGVAAVVLTVLTLSTLCQAKLDTFLHHKIYLGCQRTVPVQGPKCMHTIFLSQFSTFRDMADLKVALPH